MYFLLITVKVSVWREHRRIKVEIEPTVALVAATRDHQLALLAMLRVTRFADFKEVLGHTFCLVVGV